MKVPRSTFQKSICVGAIFAASLMVPTFCHSQSTTAPDNTAQNQNQNNTADQQSNHKSDVAITRQIRQSVIADKSLSVYAHNVKIITRHGMVTLKGPVRSEDEKQAVAGKAAEVVGSPDKVKNELTVESSGN